MYVHICTSMHMGCMNGHTCECSHASDVREDQCVRIDVVLPSAREVNGGGGGGGERVGAEWDERRAPLNGCDANGTRGHRNQFTLLKQMRAAQPCHGVRSLFFLAAPIVIVINPPNPNP